MSKSVILSPSFDRAVSKSALEQTLTTSNNLRCNERLEVRQYIGIKSYNKLIDQPEEISDPSGGQALFEFLDSQFCTPYDESLVGKFVYISETNTETDPIAKLPAIITSLQYGEAGEDIGYVVPYTFDLELASTSSLILDREYLPNKKHVPSKIKRPLALLCEFENPVVLSQLDLIDTEETENLDKQVVNKIINFIDKKKLDTKYFTTGTDYKEGQGTIKERRLLVERLVQQYSELAAIKLFDDFTRVQADENEKSLDYTLRTFDSVFDTASKIKRDDTDLTNVVRTYEELEKNLN